MDYLELNNSQLESSEDFHFNNIDKAQSEEAFLQDISLIVLGLFCCDGIHSWTCQ